MHVFRTVSSDQGHDYYIGCEWKLNDDNVIKWSVLERDAVLESRFHLWDHSGNHLHSLKLVSREEFVNMKPQGLSDQEHEMATLAALSAETQDAHHYCTIEPRGNELILSWGMEPMPQVQASFNHC